MIKTLTNLWKIKDLRNKILFTMLMLAIYRFGTFVPVPGVNLEQLGKLFEAFKSQGEGADKIASIII